MTKTYSLFGLPAILEDGSGVLLIALPGHEGPDGSDVVLSLDLNESTVTRLSTGEVLSFATDKPGFVNRPSFVTVPSQSDSDKEYHVYMSDPDDYRTWVCDCPDFHYRRFQEGQTCKHIGYADGYGYTRLKG